MLGLDGWLPRHGGWHSDWLRGLRPSCRQDRLGVRRRLQAQLPRRRLLPVAGQLRPRRDPLRGLQSGRRVQPRAVHGAKLRLRLLQRWRVQQCHRGDPADDLLGHQRGLRPPVASELPDVDLRVLWPVRVRGKRQSGDLQCADFSPFATPSGTPGSIAFTPVQVAQGQCNNNFNWWVVGSRTQYNFTPWFYVGFDVIYQKLETASNGTFATFSALTGAAKPTAVYQIKDQDNYGLRIRGHRDIVP